MRFVVTVIANAVGFWLLALFLPGLSVEHSQAVADTLGNDTAATIGSYLFIGLLLGVVNGLIRPIVDLLALPITCLTLGLFSLVIAAGMLMLTAWLSSFTPIVLTLDGFFAALLAAIGMWIVAGIVSAVLERVFVRDEHGRA